MSLCYIDFKELQKFYSLSEDELKHKSYLELEAMEHSMKLQMREEAGEKNRISSSFKNMTIKYFTPYKMLRKWWSDDEIVAAVSRNMVESEITEIYPVEGNGKCSDPNSELIGRQVCSIPNYYMGRRLYENKTVMCNTYRIKNRFQGIKHGSVILDLLYGKYPQLSEFMFKAYEYSDYEERPYEIYPKNNVYVPFNALMTKDIGAIIKRNTEYAKLYNAGIYTPAMMAERLASKEVLHMFDVIKNLQI